MRRLTAKVLVILLPIALLVAFLYSMPYFLPLKYSYSLYGAAHIDKQNILKNTPSPKIIFVGGSNIAFGLDTEKIGKELGYATVNMGLSTGFGLDFMLNEIKPFVKQNDIVVLILEYGNFFHGNLSHDGFLRNLDEKAVAALLFVDPEAGRYLPPFKKYRAILKNISVLVKIRGGDLVDAFVKDREWIRTSHGEPALYRAGFNKNGDLVGYLDHKSPNSQIKPPMYPLASQKLDYGAISRLNDFVSFAAGRGAQTFLIFPSLAESSYQLDKREIEILYGKLKEEPKIQLLASPTDYVFPDTLFWDTYYHLNKEGRKIRTDKIIDCLAKVLPGRRNMVK